MTASLETLVIAAYVFADGVAIPRPGPSGKTTDAVSEALPSGLERTESIERVATSAAIR